MGCVSHLSSIANQIGCEEPLPAGWVGHAILLISAVRGRILISEERIETLGCDRLLARLCWARHSPGEVVHDSFDIAGVWGVQQQQLVSMCCCSTCFQHQLVLIEESALFVMSVSQSRSGLICQTEWPSHQHSVSQHARHKDVRANVDILEGRQVKNGIL